MGLGKKELQKRRLETLNDIADATGMVEKAMTSFVNQIMLATEHIKELRKKLDDIDKEINKKL